MSASRARAVDETSRSGSAERDEKEVGGIGGIRWPQADRTCG